jgi:hypothetical protein
MKPQAALLLGLAWLGFAMPGLAQDERPIELTAGGTELFRALLDYKGVKPAVNVREYRDKIVIVFGKPPSALVAAIIQQETKTVLTKGGAVLFISDRGMDLTRGENQIVEEYLPNGATDAYFVPATVTGRTNCYAGLPECPFVTPIPTVAGSPPAAADFNPFAGLNKVATNKPGILFLSRQGPRAVRFAAFDPRAKIAHTVPKDRLDRYELVFAAGQDLNYPSRSRWMAVADEDVLTNSLLAAKGTDNFVLAFHIVDWLRGPEGRSECLFYEYGRRVDKFDEVQFVTVPDLPGPPVPPIPPLKVIEEQLTDFGNKVADDAQTNDRLHSALVRDEFGYARWLRFLAVVAAVGAAVFLVRLAWAARQPSPGPTVSARDDGPPGQLLAALRQEMVRGNNFTPAVVAYIDETFRLAGLPAGPHAQMPPVAITGKKVKKVELMKDIAALWRVAYGQSTGPVHYAEWRALEPAVEHVRRLAVKGRWRFAPDFVPPGAAA